ncbi:MAG: cupin domain-containing protein [Clostridium sp.]|nr:cupin domain-containing protein [Clostridium sp.]
MEIKKTDMKVADKMALKPVSVDDLNEPKKLLGMTPKFKTMYFDFEVGKGLPDHVHNGYASIFVYDGKVKMEFESGEKFEFKKGDYLAFDARVRHNVIAEVPSKILVHISEVVS